ncbi:MAG: cryptochrome/photolyase family protein [Pseudomonadota bacterium]
MSVFLQQLRRLAPTNERGRRWCYVPYDQLNEDLSPLADQPAAATGIVLIETAWKPAQRPYHQQKLALILANQRHFALEQARRGVAVRYLIGEADYGRMLQDAARELGTITCARPAERELRALLQGAVDEGWLSYVDHTGWLTTPEQFNASQRRVPWRMDAFYRQVRRDSGVMMQAGKPVGGKFSFDADNRKPWKGDPPAPAEPRFARDPIKTEVAELVAARYGTHPGRIDLDSLPATRADAESALGWALTHALPTFGPYEDAMSVQSPGLFHTRLAPLMNLHRLLPRRVLDAVLALDLELASKEGFVRQLLGWREFMRHVHEATDGFRSVPNNVLRAHASLPAAFWGQRSGLECLDRVVADVWATGYSHHITRLMVLANIATLLDVDPAELSDWYWVAYLDAFDWVVEPNVLGMGTFSLGELFTTKPYVSGAGYVHRMSDYCGHCAFNPRKDCPLTPMYWAFLARNAQRLQDCQRIKLPLKNVERRDPALRERDARVFARTNERLAQGARLTPADYSDL